MRIDILQPIEVGLTLVNLIAIPKAVLGKELVRQANQPPIVIERFAQPE